MRFGPQTGANHGKRDFKAQTETRGLNTGAHWKAEEQRRKKAEAKERKEDKRIAKLEKQARQQERKESGKFFY